MTDKELIGKLDTMVKALQKAKKKTDKTRILLDARKDFGDEADELMAFFRFLLDPAIVTGLSDAKINKKDEAHAQPCPSTTAWRAAFRLP